MLFALMIAPAASGQEEPVVTRDAPPDPTAFRLEEVAGGFRRPLYLTHAGDGSGRLFVVEQGGKIWILQDGERLDAPFLDVSGLVSPEALGAGYTERGLLGLAFHPDYAENGRFFVHYTDQNGNTAVVEYAVSADDPNLADPGSARVIFQTDQPFGNHNGGQIEFGPDGDFYIALGDGGSAGDPLGNGQNRFSPLGKILRIDVDNAAGDAAYRIPEDNPFADGAEGLPEVWAYGLRNPWRFSFDRATGDLYIGDVGQGDWEEISFQAAGSAGGLNFGWNVVEGTHPFEGVAAPDMTPPIVEYSHADGCSVTGGYVYRGKAIPDLKGVYLYGDWCSGVLWGAYRDSAGAWQSVRLLETSRAISSFGEDEAGELYLVDHNGPVLRFAPAT